MTSKEKLETVMNVILEAAKLEMPSGHLYARLMEYGLSLNAYERIIGTLENLGAIKVKNNLITVP